MTPLWAGRSLRKAADSGYSVPFAPQLLSANSRRYLPILVPIQALLAKSA
jgi:hypothetical protein